MSITWRPFSFIRRRLGSAHVCASAASISCFFFTWWIVARSGIISPAFLPSPFAIFPAGAQLFATGELQLNVLMSLIRIGGGFLFAGVLGIPLGLAIGRSARTSDIFEPLLDLTRQIPAVAWIPLAIIWFGFGEGARVFIVFLGAFFPIVISTADGVRGVNPRVISAAESLGATKSAIFWKVSLPAAMPSILTGITTGLGAAFVNIVAAELAGATNGIGYMMLNARELLQTDVVILGMVILMVIGTGLMAAMLIVRRYLLRWAFDPADNSV